MKKFLKLYRACLLVKLPKTTEQSMTLGTKTMFNSKSQIIFIFSTVTICAYLLNLIDSIKEIGSN